MCGYVEHCKYVFVWSISFVFIHFFALPQSSIGGSNVQVPFLVVQFNMVGTNDQTSMLGTYKLSFSSIKLIKK